MITKIVDVLLVEDRDEDAELAIMALKKHGFANNIKRVKDGQQALDFIFAQNGFSDRVDSPAPNLVLLDLKMPKVNGLEVIEWLKSNRKTRRIPIVVLTTSKEEQDMIKAYDLGVNSYIVKPVNFEQFAKSVKDIGMYWLLLNEPPS